MPMNDNPPRTELSGNAIVWACREYNAVSCPSNGYPMSQIGGRVSVYQEMSEDAGHWVDVGSVEEIEGKAAQAR